MTADKELLEGLRGIEPWLVRAVNHSIPVPMEFVVALRTAIQRIEQAAPSATAALGPEWADCSRCGAAILTVHPLADPAVVVGALESAAAAPAPAQAEPVAGGELWRLREIEHRVWHLLDDSEERQGEVVLHTGADYESLIELLPEDHPAAPVDSQGTAPRVEVAAIRDEALEEAAKVCLSLNEEGEWHESPEECAHAIRALRMKGGE